MTRIPIADRTVHAEVPDSEWVVRYDRSGKWYIEIAGARQHVGVREAARRALELAGQSGVIHFGLPGGATFDRHVRKGGR